MQSTEQTVQSTKQWTETKAERKARKARERAGLSVVTTPTPKVETASKPKNYIVCLKWGNKYSADYVNNLRNMVARHTTVDYEFVCFTDDSSGIDKDIRVEPLPRLPATGWWFKPYFLSADLPLDGTLLFLDLDLVVFNNIDHFFTYQPNKFCIIRDFNRQFRRNWDRMNSSVFRTQVGMYHNLYHEFQSNTQFHTKQNRGDQDWMFRHIKDHAFWPDDWIQSYKWEMRERSALKMIDGKRNFVDIKDPKIISSTSIAVFHGDPNPHNCKDPWVVDNWR